MLRNRQRPSRAAPTTTCQKCLKKGHYSYECTSSVQDRPYASRASRTQQLLNPKLKPKLTESVPEEFVKKKEEVVSKSSAKPDNHPKSSERPAKRSRAASYSSVSTISTSRSRSQSPARRTRPHRDDTAMDTSKDWEKGHAGVKRGRSYSPSPSVESRSMSPPRQADRVRRDDRNIRRRHSSISPAPRGRALFGERSRSRGYDSHDSRSPSRGPHQRRRSSIDRSRVARERASYTPEENRKSRVHDIDNRDLRVHATRYAQDQHGSDAQGGANSRLPRERSLSPYSKRLLLTQSMNGKAER